MAQSSCLWLRGERGVEKTLPLRALLLHLTWFLLLFPGFPGDGRAADAAVGIRHRNSPLLLFALPWFWGDFKRGQTRP